jgi:hypothetical protein
MSTPTSGRSQLTLHRCPQCGQVAEEQWRRARGSGPRSSALVKMLCVSRHWFLMPSEQLSDRTVEEEPA